MRIVRQDFSHTIKAILNHILHTMLLRSPSQMHQLSKPCPSQCLFNWAIFDGIILNNPTIQHILSRYQRYIFTTLLIRHIGLRFYIILHIPEDIIGAFTYEHFHHFRITNLHRNLQGRSLTIRRVRRASHRLQYMFEYLYVA